MFSKWEAKKWWGENYDRIMELYNIQRFNRQALNTPSRFEDEDELEVELEELEGAELEEQLLQPTTTAPAVPVHVPAGRQPTHPVPAKQHTTPEEDELAALQAEMHFEQALLCMMTSGFHKEL